MTPISVDVPPHATGEIRCPQCGSLRSTALAVNPQHLWLYCTDCLAYYSVDLGDDRFSLIRERE